MRTLGGALGGQLSATFIIRSWSVPATTRRLEKRSASSGMNARMTAIRATPHRYNQETVYGPFHRRTKADDQPADLLKAILSVGELWGRGPRDSPIPAALAYFGELPADTSGVEFYSFVEPDRPYGPVVCWRSPPHGRARWTGTWAKVKVVVSRASKDCL